MLFLQKTTNQPNKGRRCIVIPGPHVPTLVGDKAYRMASPVLLLEQDLIPNTYSVCLLKMTVWYILQQAGSVMYIDTEKKFSSRRIVEMAKSRWPHIFGSQVLLNHHCICSPILLSFDGMCESECVCCLYPKNQLHCCFTPV